MFYKNFNRNLIYEIKIIVCLVKQNEITPLLLFDDDTLDIDRTIITHTNTKITS